jgi:restriction endonuclease S subunit
MSWKNVRLGEVLEYEQPTKYIVESTNYKDDYEIPVLTAGQSFILGYTDETNNIFENIPVIIFDDFTTAFKYVDFPFKVKSSAMKILKADENRANIRFLYHLMQTINVDSEQHKRFWISKYSQLKIPLPPLATQKKIAAILDEADKLRQLDKQLIEKYDALTQSLFLEMFGDPVTNPKGWVKKKLAKVTTKIGSGATPQGGKEAYKSEGISLIRSLNVHDNEFRYKDLAFIDEDQANKLSNVIIEKEDVLFNITGASVCRCCIVPEDTLPARVNQHASILRPKKTELNSYFLMFCLISENVKRTLLGIGGQGGATREAITKSDLENFELIIPSIDIQNQFAERVKSIEAQKAQAQQSLQKSEELFKSLLQKAFKGELT